MGDFALARIVRIVAGIVVGIIGLAIIFIVLHANHASGIVSTVRDWADALTSPFHNVFQTSSHTETVALNYRLAILVYLVLMGLVERLLTSSRFAGGERPLPY